LTGRALEIAIGTFVISYILTRSLELSMGVAMLNETLCAIISYFNERAWNLVQWGRRIIHEGIEKASTLRNGIFEAEVTLYKSGNVHIMVKNLVTGDVQRFQKRKKNGKGYID